MRKLWPILLALVLTLVGCSGTNPALKDVWLKNLLSNYQSFETTQTITFSSNLRDVLEDRELHKESHMVLDLLESGIKFDIKQQDLKNAYAKVSFVKPDILRDYGYWWHENNPGFEFVVNNNLYFFRTASEDQFFYYEIEDLESMVENDPWKSAMLSGKFQPIFDELTKYIGQYDYSLQGIKDRGNLSIETPVGRKEVRHLQVEITLDDLKDMTSYTLGNIAEYKGLNNFINEINKMIGEEPPTKAEIEYLRAQMQDAKEELDSFSIVDFAIITGYLPEINIKADLYVTKDVQITKSKITSTLTLQPIEVQTEYEFLVGERNRPKLEFELSIDSMRWNMNQKVKYDLPDLQKSISIIELENNLEGLAYLDENSFVRKMIENSMPTISPREGTLTLGSKDAVVNGYFVEYDVAPYALNGHTLVPIRVITDIAETEPIWNGETKQVTFIVDENMVVIQVGNQIAYVNGAAIKMPVAPEIKDGRVFVPLRFVSENLGATVEWNGVTKIIDIKF